MPGMQCFVAYSMLNGKPASSITISKLKLTCIFFCHIFITKRGQILHTFFVNYFYIV